MFLTDGVTGSSFAVLEKEPFFVFLPKNRLAALVGVRTASGAVS